MLKSLPKCPTAYVPNTLCTGQLCNSGVGCEEGWVAYPPTIAVHTTAARLVIWLVFLRKWVQTVAAFQSHGNLHWGESRGSFGKKECDTFCMKGANVSNLPSHVFLVFAFFFDQLLPAQKSYLQAWEVYNTHHQQSLRLMDSKVSLRTSFSTFISALSEELPVDGSSFFVLKISVEYIVTFVCHFYDLLSAFICAL